MKDITFIMSVCNTKEKWLRRSINSVIAQSRRTWDLIIVDDGSGIETAKFLDEYAAKDDRINIYHQENKGLSSARNYGMDNARSQWVAFLDADDWIEFNYVERVMEVLTMHPELELLGIGHDDIWGNKKIDRLWGISEFYQYSSADKKDIQMSLLQEPSGLDKQPVFFGAQWKFIYSLAFLNKYGIRNNPAVLKAQDSVFNLYVSEYMKKAGYYNKVLYHYFHNNASVTGGGFNNNIVKKLQTLVEARREALEDIGKFSDPEYKSAWVKNALLEMETMLSSYFLNKNKMDSSNKRRDIMLEVLSNEPYKTAISCECSGLSLYRRLLLKMMRLKSYTGICILYRFKKRLSRVSGK